MIYKYSFVILLTTMDKETIINSISSDVSAFVSDKFNEYISFKVKEEVEKEKEKFLKDLNMCQEEFPAYNESQHKRLKACKITNDHEIPYQKDGNRSYEIINTDKEYILTNINITYKSFDFNQKIFSGELMSSSSLCSYSLTNKGNIYATQYGEGCGCGYLILFNYKILEFLRLPSCCGSMLVQSISNGREQGCRLITKEELVDKIGTWSNIDKWLNCRNGSGCKYQCEIYVKDKNRINSDKNNYRLGNQVHYRDITGWKEDCVQRFIKNDICQICGSGEILKDSITDINPEVIRNPPSFNCEYVELLTLLSNKHIIIPIYEIQTIYAKYHPRANEHYVIEEKIRKLSDLEKSVENAVKVEKDTLEKQIDEYEKKNKCLTDEYEKKNKCLTDEINQLNEHKIKLEKDKKTLQMMNKHAEEKINQEYKKKNIKYDDYVKKQDDQLNHKKNSIEEDRQEIHKSKQAYKENIEKLLKIALIINEANDKIDDKFSISEDLFSIVRELNTMIDK